MKVLIVDDEAPIRAICERTLRDDGYAIATAETGEDAARLLSEEWDIVLSDIMMPGSINGIELLRRVKEAGNADVLMMTAAPELTVALQALKLGAYDFIIKPFDPDVLRLAVRHCADKRNLSVELAREKALRAELDQAHRELARMQKVKDVFGLFVTPEVVNHVLTLPQDQWKEGTLKTVTVIFADVRRFTPFAGKTSPKSVVETLNVLLECFVRAVQQEGGIVNKFMGDGILALFGAPVELKDHAAAAARAALKANEAVGKLGSRIEGFPALRLGFGINTGEVVAGCLGTPERTEYSVIGHAVNLAARLEKAAGPGEILVGPETQRLLAGSFRLQSKEPLNLAGIEGPVSAAQLLAQDR